MLRLGFVSLSGLIVNYILLNSKAHIILDSYVYCMSVVGLVFVFSNWGGRDFLVKTLSKDLTATSGTMSAVMNSRLILLVLIGFVFLLVPVSLNFRWIVLAHLCLRTFNVLYEGLITVRKEFYRFLVLDVFLSTTFILLLLFDRNTSDPYLFLYELLGIELLRLLINVSLFRKTFDFRFDLRSGFRFLKNSTPFFYISLAGFVCSRADLYVLGLLMESQQMSIYFILLNLVSLCHVAFATFQNTYDSTTFRFNASSFKKFARYASLLGFVFSLLACAAIYILCTFYYHIPLSLTFYALIFLNIFLFSLVHTQMYQSTRLGKQKLALAALVVAGVINISISVLTLNHFGMTGAFAGNTIGMFFTFFILRTGLRKAEV